MDHDALVALLRLAVSAAVAIALMLVWCLGSDSWFRPAALLSVVLVAAPVVLIAAINTGRVLRRRGFARTAPIATRVSQLSLGGFSCLVAVGVVSKAILGTAPAWLVAAWCPAASVGILLYGVSLLLARSAGAEDDGSS